MFVLSFTQAEELFWSDEFEFLDESKWTHLVSTYPLVSGKLKGVQCT